MKSVEAEVRRYNSRLGLALFVIYLAFYLGFVLINAFRPSWMEWVAWGGLNLAILYGFGLIVAALVLALIYGFSCRAVPPKVLEGKDSLEEGKTSAPGDEA